MKFSERLEILRKQKIEKDDLKKLPNARIERDAGLSNGMLKRFEGNTRPTKSTIIKLADYFQVPVTYLTGEEDDVLEGIRISQAPETIKSKNTCIQLSVQNLFWPTDEMNELTDCKSVWVNPDEYDCAPSDLFAYAAADTSMSPLITPGDILICQKTDELSSDLHDIPVIFSVQSGPKIIRYVTVTQDGCIFYPENTEFVPVYITNQEIKTLPVILTGKVLEIRHKV